MTATVSETRLEVGRATGLAFVEKTVEPRDCDGNGSIGISDFECQHSFLVDALLDEPGLIRGDVDLDGTVGFSDFLQLSENFGFRSTRTEPQWSYQRGDVNLDKFVQFDDFLELSAVFGQSLEGPAPKTIPEPTGTAVLWSGTLFALLHLRRRRI